MAWLQNLVWPEQVARRERLAAAIEIARAEPPYLRTGDLLTRSPACSTRRRPAPRRWSSTPR